MPRAGAERFYGQCVDLSGIIFVVLALAWAVYLIPKALKHHDEIARTRSVDRFSTAMRVLARREPVNRSETRLVVTPHSATEPFRPTAPSASATAPTPTSTAAPATTRPGSTTAPATASGPAPSPVKSPAKSPGPRRPAASRAAARAAARRRRRILLVLVVADLATVTVAAIGLAPWWSVAIPVSLTLCYLFLCRLQAKHAYGARGARDASPAQRPAAERARPTTPRRAARVDAAYGTPQTVGRVRAPQEVSPDEDTIGLSVTAVTAALGAPSAAEADAAAARALAAEGGSLWDPLPMTLPTYVNKRRAVRTVRTINLEEPGTWTSGRSASDSQLVEDSTAAQGEAASPQDEQRAVGS